MLQQIDIPAELNQRLKMFAVENKISNLKNAIVKCIQEYLDIYDYNKVKREASVNNG